MPSPKCGLPTLYQYTHFPAYCRNSFSFLIRQKRRYVELLIICSMKTVLLFLDILFFPWGLSLKESVRWPALPLSSDILMVEQGVSDPGYGHKIPRNYLRGKRARPDTPYRR